MVEFSRALCGKPSALNIARMACWQECFSPIRRHVPRRWSETAIRANSVEPFTELLRSLRRIEFERDRSGEPVSGIVELSQTAKNLYCEFYNEHAQEQETLDDDLAAAWSKLEEYAARLAMIIHVCRHVSGEDVAEREVDEISMAAGIVLTRWFCRETRRVYAVLEQSESERACHELADWIRRKGGEVSVPRSSRRAPPVPDIRRG